MTGLFINVQLVYTMAAAEMMTWPVTSLTCGSLASSNVITFEGRRGCLPCLLVQDWAKFCCTGDLGGGSTHASSMLHPISDGDLAAFLPSVFLALRYII